MVEIRKSCRKLLGNENKNSMIVVGWLKVQIDLVHLFQSWIRVLDFVNHLLQGSGTLT